MWGKFYAKNTLQGGNTRKYGRRLRTQAKHMKAQFNKLFIFKENGKYYAAQALDGYKNKIKTVTGNPLLLLWAAYKRKGRVFAIVKRKYIPDIVARAMSADMFDPEAGVRTMSTQSPTYISGQESYHNGSFWPKLNGMSHEGLQNFGYTQEASQLKYATLKPMYYFGSAIELYVKTDNGQYELFKNQQGQESCKQQAWSAAAALDLLTLE
jgi:glycogen debranching enzyme